MSGGKYVVIKRIHYPFFIVLLLLSFSVSERFAQKTSTDRPARQFSSDRKKALEILVETANQARQLDDGGYRAKIIVTAAGALFPFDAVRARTFFVLAYEAAAEADLQDAEAEHALGFAPRSAQTSFTEWREEILRRIAASDPTLAETLLKKLAAERFESDATSEREKKRSPWRELTPASKLRLALATHLMGSGEYDSSAQIARPVLREGPSGDLIAYLNFLRWKSASHADPLYAELLRASAAATDANDILLLSSFLLSPEILVVVDQSGALQFRSLYTGGDVNQTPLVESLRTNFLKLAAGVLLRPFNSATDFHAERAARFFAIGRLLPLFEQGGAQFAQFAQVLRLRRETLSLEIDEIPRQRLSAHESRTRLRPQNATDPLVPELERLSHAAPADRDMAAVAVIKVAARNRLWDRAKRAANPIGDLKLKQAALSFIAVRQIADIARASKEEKEDEYEIVTRFVSTASVPSFAKAWGYAQAASIASRKADKNQIISLVDEGARYAASSDSGLPRIFAYIVTTGAAIESDHDRAWELLADLTTAINQAAEYAGDEISMSLDEADSGFEPLFTIGSEQFRLDSLFARMAAIDFQEAVEIASRIERQAPRSFAMIAAARSALVKSSVGDPTRRN